MKLTMLLADSAQAVGGKLYILGGGWSIIGPDPTPMALAIKIDVPWTEANNTHTLRLALFDEDGQAVMVPTPTGTQSFEIHTSFEVGRPAGLKPGTPLDLALAINLPPLPLRSDTRYVWRCFVDNAPAEEVSFLTRPLPTSKEK